MTMGLKIHRMLKDERSDPPEMIEEAKKRRDMSDSILEMIYSKLTSRGKNKHTDSSLLDDDGPDQ
ncbi:MAG: hypothetical protein JXA22_01030 [Candidatus Thermoplasmatota archaeon]|nr:hypothetical protein [Candidatus Thermoplasmatota archaeon]